MGLCHSGMQQYETPTADPITPPHTPPSAMTMSNKQKHRQLTYTSNMSNLRMTPPTTPPTQFTQTHHLKGPSTIKIAESADSEHEITNNNNNPQSDTDIYITPSTLAPKQAIYQHKINWSLRLSSHPRILTDTEPNHHQSTGTVVKYTSADISHDHGEQMYLLMNQQQLKWIII